MGVYKLLLNSQGVIRLVYISLSLNSRRDDCMGGSPFVLRDLASSIRASSSFSLLTASRSRIISSKEVYSAQVHKRKILVLVF